MLYPSLAFETSDNSSSFFGNNAGFVLEFAMGGGPFSIGLWPLFYSISNDTNDCSGIWGSGGVSSTWPPSNGLWGAGGLTVKYLGRIISYEAIIGSIGKMKNNAIVNTTGTSCRYIDTELNTLNMES